MKVEVRLYATLRRYAAASNGVMTAELAEGTTVAGLMHHFGIDPAEVQLFMVNGMHSQPEQRLMDGDRVGLFPPVGGG